jgi:hypothetical protein
MISTTAVNVNAKLPDSLGAPSLRPASRFPNVVPLITIVEHAPQSRLAQHGVCLQMLVEISLLNALMTMTIVEIANAQILHSLGVRFKRLVF